MSIKTFDSALDFVPEKAARRNTVWSTIVETFSAIREGIDLAAEYKDLTNRGMPSDKAARQVFDQIGKH